VTKSNESILVKEVKKVTIPVKIEGLTTLLSHNWGKVQVWQMWAKQQFGEKCNLLKNRLPRCKYLEFAESLHWVSEIPEVLNYNLPSDENDEDNLLEKYVTFVKQINKNPEIIMDEIKKGVFGLKACAVKGALVDACRNFHELNMTQMRQAVSVEGTENKEYIVLRDGEGNPAIPYLHESIVVLNKKAPDFRYRGAFDEWYFDVKIHHVDTISSSTVLSLLQAGGMCGLGDGRPSSPKSNTSNNGIFTILRGDK